MTGRIPQDLGPGYARWLGAHACSQLGVKFGAVALPVLALREAGASATQMGVITAAASVAYVALALPAGARIETLPRQVVVTWSGRGRLLACAVMLVLALRGDVEVAALALFALVVGAFSVFYDIGLAAGLPERVPADRLTSANTGFEVVQHVTTFVGPAAAGVAVAMSSAAWVIGLDGLFFAAASVCAARSRPIRGVEVPQVEPFGARLVAGLRFCWQEETIRRILLTILVSSFCATIILTLLPVLVLDELGGSSVDLALCMMAGSLGGLLGASHVRRAEARWGRPRLMVLGLGGAAVCTGGVTAAALLAGSVAARPLLLLCALAQLGIAFCIVHFNVAQVSLRQELTPLPMMARMSSVSKFFVWGSLPVAALVAGRYADSWGLSTILTVAFVGALATAVPVLGVGRHVRRQEVLA